MTMRNGNLRPSLPKKSKIALVWLLDVAQMSTYSARTFEKGEKEIPTKHNNLAWMLKWYLKLHTGYLHWNFPHISYSMAWAWGNTF